MSCAILVQSSTNWVMKPTGGVSNGLCEHLRACEHASSAFIFASTTSDQICLASSERFKKNTDGEQRALRKFSRRNLDFSLLKRNFLRHAIWLLPFNQSPSSLQPIVPCWQWCQITSFSFAECATLGGHSKRFKAFETDICVNRSREEA